jgi:hypothetical protein
MLYSDVDDLLGHPQRVRTLGIMVVEYDLENGAVLLVEYARNADGYYVVISKQIEISKGLVEGYG